MEEKYASPPKLELSDEIRVIAPSYSLGMFSADVVKQTEKTLNDSGLRVTYGKNVYKRNKFNSSSIEHRLADIHEAFSDPNVKGILAVCGGFNSNQLLQHLDYDLIKKNPKMICGYSDITALNTAITVKTNMMTYLGPNFINFGMIKGLEYTIKYFKKCLFTNSEYDIEPSPYWSDDKWRENQIDRSFFKNEGFKTFYKGSAEGYIFGGNLNTLNLLQGTRFFPDLSDCVLFLEDDDLGGRESIFEFDRNLESLMQLDEFEKVKGIVFAKFKQTSCMTFEYFREIISSKNKLSNIPIIYEADIGHTTPQAVFPLGGYCRIDSDDEISIRILKH